MRPKIRPTLRHIGALIVFIFFMAPTIYLAAINTDAYETAENFIRADFRVSDKTGAIKSIHFAFWNDFYFTDYAAEFTLYGISKNGKYLAIIHLKFCSNKWRVDRSIIYLDDRKILLIDGSQGQLI